MNEHANYQPFYAQFQRKRSIIITYRSELFASDWAWAKPEIKEQTLILLQNIDEWLGIGWEIWLVDREAMRRQGIDVCRGPMDASIRPHTLINHMGRLNSSYWQLVDQIQTFLRSQTLYPDSSPDFSMFSPQFRYR